MQIAHRHRFNAFFYDRRKMRWMQGRGQNRMHVHLSQRPHGSGSQSNWSETDICGAALFAPVLEIYDRYEALFIDTPEWQLRRRETNAYPLSLQQAFGKGECVGRHGPGLPGRHRRRPPALRISMLRPTHPLSLSRGRQAARLWEYRVDGGRGPDRRSPVRGGPAGLHP
jgi:hypothetical protein